ncbi:RidA family protein [Sphingomonas sp. Leaf21]|uniref:RidA family protein n=1 Tax=Sphingomonas sp. Leaf21 TaxID=2876550 RepID=UPI001E39D297|nr:RidA family protein [Sphingomonas sp. Leaf21]
MAIPLLPVPVVTDGAPQPAGHYPQGMIAHGCVYISGQLPIGLEGTSFLKGSFDEQARQAIANLLAIAKASGSSAAQLIRVTVYIVGVENWPRFNAVYTQMLGDACPARTVVPVNDLHHGYLVEIDGIGLVGSQDDSA